MFELASSIWGSFSIAFEPIANDIVSAIITGLIVAPSTAAVVEALRANGVRRRRRPLIAQIEAKADEIERNALRARRVIAIFEHLGFRWLDWLNANTDDEQGRAAERERLAGLVKIVDGNLERIADALTSAGRVVGASDTLPDQIERVLDMVAPHLDLVQVADMVEWSAEVARITRRTSDLAERFDDMGHALRRQRSKDERAANADLPYEIADLVDDVRRMVDVYAATDQGEPRSKRSRSGSGAATKKGLRERIAQHFSGKQWKLRFEQRYEKSFPPLQHESVEELLDMLDWIWVE